MSKIEKKIMVRGELLPGQFICPDEYRVLIAGRLISVANMNEMHINSGRPSGPLPRALMVEGRLRDDDLDMALQGLPDGAELTLQRSNLEVVGVMKVAVFGSVIEIWGVSVGGASPDTELSYDAVVDGDVVGRAVCYEPIVSGRPRLHMDVAYSGLAQVMAAALAAGKNATLSAVAAP